MIITSPLCLINMFKNQCLFNLLMMDILTSITVSYYILVRRTEQILIFQCIFDILCIEKCNDMYLCSVHQY